MGWAMLRDVCALAVVFAFIGAVLIWGTVLEEVILTARGGGAVSNSNGSYRISRDAVWRAFDNLPEAVRERLTQSNCDWVPTPLSRKWDAGSTRAAELFEIVEWWDRIDTAAHFSRFNRMVQTGTDYNARLTKAGLRKYGEAAA